MSWISYLCKLCPMSIRRWKTKAEQCHVRILFKILININIPYHRDIQHTEIQPTILPNYIEFRCLLFRTDKRRWRFVSKIIQMIENVDKKWALFLPFVRFVLGNLAPPLFSHSFLFSDPKLYQMQHKHCLTCNIIFKKCVKFR